MPGALATGFRQRSNQENFASVHFARAFAELSLGLQRSLKSEAPMDRRPRDLSLTTVREFPICLPSGLQA